MTRVSRYKIAYIVAIGLGTALFLVVLALTQWNPVAGIILMLVCFFPGRLQGSLYRDFFQGRRALNHNNPVEARTHFERFLVTIRDQPWRRHVLWLSGTIYTPNIEAMTLNNIGTAYLALEEIEKAETTLREALACDPLYPIPYTNLALIAAIRGDSKSVDQLLASAKELGYTGNSFDLTVHQAQSLLART